MKPSQLTKRIEELSEKLKPIPSEGIRIDFKSFTEPEQLVLLKNFELDDKYRYRWTREAILENKDLIPKCNHNDISPLDRLPKKRSQMVKEKPRRLPTRHERKTQNRQET